MSTENSLETGDSLYYRVMADNSDNDDNDSDDGYHNVRLLV